MTEITNYLDQNDLKLLNSLSYESLRDSHTFEHELLIYGIDSVGHYNLMTNAQKFVKRDVESEKYISRYGMLQEFISRYGIRTYYFHNRNLGLLASLQTLEDDGIFVPQQVRGREFQLFSPDYYWNKFIVSMWDEQFNAIPKKIEKYSYAGNLTHRIWSNDDFNDEALVISGIQFGKDMLEICVNHFEKNILDKPLQLNIVDLGRKLIEYYSAIVLQ